MKYPKWTYSLIGLLLQALLLGGIYLLWSANVNDTLASKQREQTSAFTATTHNYGEVSSLMYASLANNQTVRDLLRQGIHAENTKQQAVLRGKLLRTLWTEYELMQAHGLSQLHFHTPDGHSYLRFHKPELSGDALLSFRPSIAQVLETGETVQGFENGRLFHGYRYVYPYFDQDKIIGSVETSIGFDAIIETLREVMPENDYSFWLNQAALDGRIDRDDHQFLFPIDVNPAYAIEDIDARLDDQQQLVRPERQLRLETLAMDQQETIVANMAAGSAFSVPLRKSGLDFYAMQFMPIEDLEGNQAGYLVSYSSTPELGTITRNYALLALLTAALLAGLVFFVYRQQTAQRTLAEERSTFKSISDNMLEGLFVQDKPGRLVYWNPAMERILGFGPEQLNGAIVHDLIHAHDDSGKEITIDQCPIRLSTLSGKTYYNENEGFRRVDGKILPVEVTCAPVFRDGKIEGSITVFRDMTQRLEMQQAQEQARQAAEHNARMKASFLANMSHEIRTPMNGVMGMLALARDTNLTPEQKEYLDIAHQSGELLLTLLNDILDVSKVDAGQLALESVAFDLHEVVEHSARLMAPRAHEKGLELIVNIDFEAPLYVEGDPLRLRQVLLNLLGNAVKFTDCGEISINVKPNQQRLRFSIRDTGIGIDENALEHIFEPFRQADESTTRKYGGTGLGLALSKRIVSLMGGSLSADSELGKGSEFHFELELPEIEPEQAQKQDSLEFELSTLRGKHVLIVDDVATNRLLIERFTLAWGMRPHSFAEPQKALEWAEQNPAASHTEIAVLDRMMPGMDGLALAAHLRRLHPAIRLIILSSATDQAEREAVEQGLIDKALAKPAGQRALGHAIYQTLTQSVPEKTASNHQQHSSQPESSSIFTGMTVLVVEDNPVNMMLARQILQKEQVDVLSAENGLAGLEAFKANPDIDMVLMDCQMPVMDGPGATREIRAFEQQTSRSSRCPILALTAHAGLKETQTCLDAGMDLVLSKPYQKADLLKAMQQLKVQQIKLPESTVDDQSAEPSKPDIDEDEPVLDDAILDGLEEALGDDVLEIVRYFDTHLDEQIQSLVDAIEHQDHAAINAQAHALKGSTANLGAVALSALAQEIEQQGKQAQTPTAEESARLQALSAATRTALRTRFKAL